MTEMPNILLIAPEAPPRNTAEAIQVRRILGVLDQQARGTLVTVAAVAAGWEAHDESLALKLRNFNVCTLALPWHRVTCRVVMSHRMARFHVPDPMAWIIPMAGTVERMLTTAPDIIYSRSQPMSSALLAQKLKRRLNIPWMMHLSDPWAENPHATPGARRTEDEAACFSDADLITLTTAGQAGYYQKKYPMFAHKIIVTPNVMPDLEEAKALLAQAPAIARDDRLRIVFAGNLYGVRTPLPLMQAIEHMRHTHPDLLRKLRVDIYGQVQDHCMQMLLQAPDVVHHHGPISFAQSYAEQQAADLLLTIDTDGTHPLYQYFLPCKVTDSLALGTPLLALTPEGSETTRLCAEGYGWAAPPSRPDLVANYIAQCIGQLPAMRAAPRKAPPPYYAATTVVGELLRHVSRLAAARKA